MVIYFVVGGFVAFVLLAMVFGPGKCRRDGTWDAGGDSGGGSDGHHGHGGGSGCGGGSSCGGGGGE